MLPHPTFFVKKEIYQKYGLYNTNLKSAADYEMILRLLHKEKITVEYIPEILIKMRMGGESNASIWNRLKGNNEDNIAWDLNGLKKPPFIRFIKPFRKISQFFRKPKCNLKVLIIDNQDSFTYNLKHYVQQFYADVDVLRASDINIESISEYNKVILSPGPGLPEEHPILNQVLVKYYPE